MQSLLARRALRFLLCIWLKKGSATHQPCFKQNDTVEIYTLCRRVKTPHKGITSLLSSPQDFPGGFRYPPIICTVQDASPLPSPLGTNTPSFYQNNNKCFYFKVRSGRAAANVHKFAIALTGHLEAINTLSAYDIQPIHTAGAKLFIAQQQQVSAPTSPMLKEKGIHKYFLP